MHLRTLTLRGFKSFASATTLHFEPGITCIVGPNGSGKSNVVDALAWVMGEQGAKSLRGGAMADVIFAGTATRPPLGRAEVSLTIDNTDGALPIAYSEVTISRTLFRNGGSEYALNGSPCRLLDIQELLSDTGMGREMHVIVGQGQLDAVLSAGPDERRGFIEEAAGVLKHRRRKEKALRKLEAMAANLQRVTDLATELRRQLGPLARQADVARRAAVIQADVRDARSRLLADDLVQAQALLASGTADEDAARRRLQEAEARSAELRGRLAALEADAARLSPRLREATDTYYALVSLRERLVSVHSLAQERVRHLGTPGPASTGEDPEVLEARAERARAEEESLRALADEARARLDAAIASRSAAEERERAAEARLAAVNRGLADRREGLARLTGQVAARRSRLEAAEAEAGRLREAHAAALRRAEASEREYAALEREAVGAEDGELDLDRAHEAALAALAAAEEQLRELDERESAAKAALAHATTRHEALALSLRRTDATGALLASDAALAGALPDHLHVAEGWETAVAAALGPLADAAVATSPDTAVDAIRAARSGNLGAVRLVVASAGEPHPAGGAPAGALWARDATACDDPRLSGTVHTLLEGVVLVEDLADARRVVRENATLVAATRDGDVVAASWASGGGDAESSVFALHAAAEEARAAARAAARDLEGIRFEYGPARAAVDAARAEAEATLAALHRSDAAIAAVAERLARLGAAVRAAQAEAERTAPLIARVEDECAGHRRELEALVTRLEAASSEPAEAEESVRSATRERDAASAAAREARRAETDARLEVRTVEERVTSIAGRASSLRVAARAERDARRRAEDRERRRAWAAAAASSVRDDASATLAALASSIGRAADERAALESERTAGDAERTQLRAQLDEASAQVAALSDAAHRDEVLRAERRLRVEQLAERAIAELGIDPATLIDEFGPHVPVPGADGTSRPYDREEQQQRLARAGRDLERLGKVNPLALEEHAALAERHQFLTAQVTDLRSSRADLLEIVREIDDRVEQVFAQAFADTRDAFRTVFARLFPGGEGDLVLTDPEDLLSSGIEIEARPAGKKVRRLSLLSGGERSLAAVAFLVAIFTARPSPFYVMDEVEAALDDVNLGRLLEIFRELREDSQLIVVTHQKRTMEVADALYGVTMRGDGVTTVISQRLRPEEA
ncbi:MAG: chromosome segregation protein SMC [Actinomycetales bacterium]|nr:chromosome segregation protein SMC [Actinomycetales bacterium]